MNGATQRFPSALRIRERRDFKLAERQGERASGAHFVVFVSGRDARPRLGLTVSRRVGGAVVRNRVKRLVREIYRRNGASRPAGDTVVIARTGAGALSYRDAAEELLRLWSSSSGSRP